MIRPELYYRDIVYIQDAPIAPTKADPKGNIVSSRNACEKIWGEELKELVEDRGKRGMYSSDFCPLQCEGLIDTGSNNNLGVERLGSTEVKQSPPSCTSEELDSACTKEWMHTIMFLQLLHVTLSLYTCDSLGFPSTFLLLTV